VRAWRAPPWPTGRRLRHPLAYSAILSISDQCWPHVVSPFRFDQGFHRPVSERRPGKPIYGTPSLALAQLWERSTCAACVTENRSEITLANRPKRRPQLVGQNRLVSTCTISGLAEPMVSHSTTVNMRDRRPFVVLALSHSI